MWRNPHPRPAAAAASPRSRELPVRRAACAERGVTTTRACSWNALARWEYASRAVSGALGDGQSAVRFFCGWMCTVTLLRDAACLKACLGQPLREFWDAGSELSFLFVRARPASPGVPGPAC